MMENREKKQEQKSVNPHTSDGSDKKKPNDSLKDVAGPKIDRANEQKQATNNPRKGLG